MDFVQILNSPPRVISAEPVAGVEYSDEENDDTPE